MACGTCTAACLEGRLFRECLLPSKRSLEGTLPNLNGPPLFIFFSNLIFFSIPPFLPFILFFEMWFLVQAYLKLA